MPEGFVSLDNLHNIVVPDPVSWWPLAYGWWFMITVVLGLAGWLMLAAIAQ